MEELDNQPKKMCIFCHAQIAMEAKICPYCRAQFDQLKSQEYTSVRAPVSSAKSLSEKQTLDSLYPPPYQPKMERIEEEIEEVEKEAQDPKTSSKQPSFLMPIFLFSLGSQLFIFSMFLLLFSEEGMLLLRWKASLWYLYSLVSIGFLFIGYKLFSNLELE